MSDWDIGFHRDLENTLKTLPSTEYQVLRNISILFRVTNIWTHSKTETYLSALLKPCKLISQRFGLPREILCVVDDHQTTDMRLIREITNRLNNQNLQQRIDQLIVFVVTRDIGAGRLFDVAGGKTVDMPHLIHFTYEELLGNDDAVKSTINTKLDRALFTRDLFGMSSPLKSETFFFGRQKALADIRSKYVHGENGSLFGLRRIGKTSVLLSAQRQGLLRKEPILFVDCSNPEVYKKTWFQALDLIRKRLFKEFLPSRKIDKTDYAETNAAGRFRSDLECIFKEYQGKRILLILDEIENITFTLSDTEGWRNGTDYLDFWRTLRSIHQERPDLLAFFIAGVNPYCLETALVGKADNPIYRYVTPQYLSFFDVSEVTEMLKHLGDRMGIMFEPNVCTYLADDFGGHPFLVRMAGSWIHRKLCETQKMRPYTITAFDYKNWRQTLLKASTDYVDQIVSTIRLRYPDEYEILEYLAIGDIKKFDSFVSESPLWIEHLEGYGLLRHQEGQTQFRIEAVKDYVVARANKRPLPDSFEGRISLISEKRNLVEKKFRNFIRVQLKNLLGKADAKIYIVSKVSKPGQKKKMELVAYDEIFSQEMYWLDLARFISGKPTEFSKTFPDITKFQYQMNHVNKCRADAHARDLSDADLTSAVSILEEIDKNLDDYS